MSHQLLNVGTPPEHARGAVVVVSEILAAMIRLFDQHVHTAPVTMADCDIIRKSSGWADIASSTAEIAAVELDGLTHDQRLTFYLNLYNLMNLHALVILGPPTSVASRIKFFSQCVYRVGKLGELSAAEVEHALLRAPMSKPTAFGSVFLPKFGKNDARLEYALTRREPLVTFGLCNGSISGPRVTIFDAENVHEQLVTCTRTYLQAHVGVNATKIRVVMPRVVDWYKVDWMKKDDEPAPSPDSISSFALLNWSLQYLSTSTVQNVQTMLKSKGATAALKVKFAAYEWLSYYYRNGGQQGRHIIVEVVEAKSLIHANHDSFVTIAPLDDDGKEIGEEKVRTPVVAKSLTPTWNFSVTLGLKKPLSESGTINFKVKGKGLLGKEIELGGLSVPWDFAQSTNRTRDEWYTLEKRKGMKNISGSIRMKTTLKHEVEAATKFMKSRDRTVARVLNTKKADEKDSKVDEHDDTEPADDSSDDENDTDHKSNTTTPNVPVAATATITSIDNNTGDAEHKKSSKNGSNTPTLIATTQDTHATTTTSTNTSDNQSKNTNNNESPINVGNNAVITTTTSSSIDFVTRLVGAATAHVTTSTSPSSITTSTPSATSSTTSSISSTSSPSSSESSSSSSNTVAASSVVSTRDMSAGIETPQQRKERVQRQREREKQRRRDQKQRGSTRNLANDDTTTDSSAAQRAHSNNTTATMVATNSSNTTKGKGSVSMEVLTPRGSNDDSDDDHTTVETQKTTRKQQLQEPLLKDDNAPSGPRAHTSEDENQACACCHKCVIS